MPEPDPSIALPPARRQRLFPWVLLAAVLMTLAFPPADLGFLAWIGLAPFIYAVQNARRPRHAFGLGYLFGYAHWGATVLWIGTTVTAWTHSPIGWVAWVGLVAVKSCWFGLFGWAAWWIGTRSSGVRRVLAVAGAWTIMEWLRCQTGVAMPWSLSGYTQYRYLPIIQAADLAGVFAISLGIALVNAGLAETEPVPRRPTGQAAPRRFPPLVPGAVYLTLMLAYGFFALGRSYDGQSIRLALMQTNEQSWRAERSVTEQEAQGSVGESLRRLSALSSRAVEARPHLVVWPESAVPQSPVVDSAVRSAIAANARATGAYHLLGSGHEDEQGKSYNSAFLFRPDGSLAERYDKTWLVPFGEWVPLRPLIPFDDVFHFPEETTPGAADALVSAGTVRMSVLICYESVFPVVSRTRVAKGANLLVGITNDSWAGESAELQQHIAMSALRAVETRRSLASSATTGITGLIEPTGRINAIPPYREDLLVVEAKLRDGLTPYVRFGDWLIGVCAGWIYLGLIPRRRRERREQEMTQSTQRA